MKFSKNENSMSNYERLAILETTILNINASLQDMRRGFDKIDNQFIDVKQDIKQRTEKIEQDMTRGFDKIDNQFINVKQDIKQRTEKIERDMMRGFDKIDIQFNNIHKRLWSNFLWLMSMIIGLTGFIAHTQHWV